MVFLMKESYWLRTSPAASLQIYQENSLQGYFCFYKNFKIPFFFRSTLVVIVAARLCIPGGKQLWLSGKFVEQKGLRLVDCFANEISFCVISSPNKKVKNLETTTCRVSVLTATPKAECKLSLSFSATTVSFCKGCLCNNWSDYSLTSPLQIKCTFKYNVGRTSVDLVWPTNTAELILFTYLENCSSVECSVKRDYRKLSPPPFGSS